MNTVYSNQQTLLEFLASRADHVINSQSVKEFLSEVQDFVMLGMSLAEFYAAKNALMEAGLLVLIFDGQNKVFAKIKGSAEIEA